MRYLGIDYGDKKIGLAIGDGETKIASPIDVIENGDHIKFLEELVKAEDIDEVVIGVPNKIGNFHSEDQLKKTHAFIENLKTKIEIPIHEVDESFTSVEAQRLQVEESAGAKEDAISAMLILQDFFERN